MYDENMIGWKQSTTLKGKIEDKLGCIRIGKKMRELRLAANLTQAEVAERMGCTQKDISRWENGREISAAGMYIFCKAVGCSMGEFDKY